MQLNVTECFPLLLEIAKVDRRGPCIEIIVHPEQCRQLSFVFIKDMCSVIRYGCR
jgi:hypothetical protein